MKISLFAIVFVSIFAFSPCAVKAEGLRGLTVTENTELETGKRQLMGMDSKPNKDSSRNPPGGNQNQNIGNGHIPAPAPIYWTSVVTTPIPQPIWVPAYPPPRPAPLPTPVPVPGSIPLFTLKPTAGGGACMGGSVYWDANLYPQWAGALRCKTSSECGNLGCCLADFCLCTAQTYNMWGACV